MSNAADPLADTFVFCLRHGISVEQTDRVMDEVVAMTEHHSRPTVGYYQRLLVARDK